MTEPWCPYCAQGVKCLDAACPVRARRARDLATLSHAYGCGDPGVQCAACVEEFEAHERRVQAVVTEGPAGYIRELMKTERRHPVPSGAVDTNCTSCGARCWLVNVEEAGVQLIDVAPVMALVPADEQGLWTVRAAYRQHECPRDGETGGM